MAAFDHRFDVAAYLHHRSPRTPMADQAAETDEDWSSSSSAARAPTRRPPAASDDGARTKAALRTPTAAAPAAAAAAETPQATPERQGRRSRQGAVEGVEKRLKSIRDMAAKETLDDAERKKLALRDDLEAARAALTAVLAGFAAKRQAADAVMGQLDDVQFDDAYECACCREVLELPVKLPCGHEYCRECVALVASRASRPSDVVCPLCRAPFYDGAKCRVAVAEKTRRKLKRATGRCHCGATLPLSGLRDHLRSCGAAAVYSRPLKAGPRALSRSHVLFEHAPLASSPAASSPLEDALRRSATSRRSGGAGARAGSGVDARAAAAAARWRRLEATPEPRWTLRAP